MIIINKANQYQTKPPNFTHAATASSRDKYTFAPDLGRKVGIGYRHFHPRFEPKGQGHPVSDELSDLRPLFEYELAVGLAPKVPDHKVSIATVTAP